MEFSLIYYLCQAADDAAPLAAQGAYSRADLVRSALRLSRVLQEKRIRAAALQFDDAVEFCTAFLACAHAGADIYLPPNTAPDNIRWAQNAAQIWLTDGRHAPDGAHTVFRLPEEIGGAEAAAGACRDIAIFLKTSGTSGAPKTVRKTFYQMQTESEALAGLAQTSGSLKNAAETITAAASVSPQHLYGLTFRIVFALTQGWKMWRDTLLYPEDLTAAARQCGKTVWITGPAVLHRLHSDSPWQNIRAHTAGIFTAGGALSAQSAENLRANGLFLCEIYGSSEAGVMAHRRQNGRWRWFDGVTAVQNADGSVQTVSPWSGGVQHNADVVEIFADGFALLGRSDRIIKLEDKRISLDDIEEQLRASEEVADACVARRAGYTHLGAWIALSEAGIQILRNRGRAALSGSLKNTLRAYTDTLALPRFWRFTDKLPRNAQGKIAAADIQAAFAALPEVPQWTRGADDGGAMVFHGRVPLDLRYFGGHFAGFPIVPGVIELRWVLDLAKENALLAPGRVMTRVENLKFQHFLRPGDVVHIALRWDDTRGKLHFSCKNQNALCASGRAVFDDGNG